MPPVSEPDLADFSAFVPDEFEDASSFASAVPLHWGAGVVDPAGWAITGEPPPPPLLPVAAELDESRFGVVHVDVDLRPREWKDDRNFR